MRTPEHNEKPDESELQAPPELVSALRRVSPKAPFVPPAVDEAVLKAARGHLEKVQPHGRSSPGFGFCREFLALLLRPKPLLAGSLAALAILFLAYQFLPLNSKLTLSTAKQSAKSAASQAAAAPDKLNPAHPLDILDALRLAKRLQAGPVSEPKWDLNGDGIVDARDVQTIAIQVVRLDKGGRS